jgi:hypothetical protein
MKYVFPVIFVALVVFLAPSAEAAPVKQKNPIFPVKAFVESTEKAALNNTVGVYTIEFTLTATDEDVYVPAAASAAVKVGDERSVGVVYGVYESDKSAPARGVTGAFLASDAERVQGYYHIEKNSTETFTLVVAYNNKGRESDEYHARINAIRYALRGTDRTITSESAGLEQFKSKEVSLVQ